MTLEGFTPYEEKAARLYEERRWWLGLSMGDIVDRMSDLYPDQEALVGSGQRYTYRELKRLTDHMAYNLLRQGFQKGDRVLLQLPNWSEFVISYYALQKAGLVVVLLTVNHTAREVSHLADLTKPKGWIVPDSYRKTHFLPQVEAVQDRNSGLDKIILVGQDRGGKYLSYRGLLDAGVSEEEIATALAEARPNPMDVCQILPSGGTTGLPKGAPRTHNDYLCNVEYKSRAWHLNVTDTCLVATTVGHNLALLVLITGPMFHGAKVVMLDSTYPEDFCRAVQEEKVTCAGLVPTLVSRLVSFEGLGHYDFSSFKKMYVGAANSPPRAGEACGSEAGLPVHQRIRHGRRAVRTDSSRFTIRGALRHHRPACVSL